MSGIAIRKRSGRRSRGPVTLVRRLVCGPGATRSGPVECLEYVRHEIVGILDPDGQPHQRSRDLEA